MRIVIVDDRSHLCSRFNRFCMRHDRIGDNVVARAVQEGLLEVLLQGFQEPDGFPLWAMLPPGRQRTAKVKVFLDFLIERFGPAPWRAKR